MKRFLPLLMLITACSGDPPEPKPSPAPAPPADSTREAPVRVPVEGLNELSLPDDVPVKEQREEPKLHLSVNGSTEPEVERGAPLIVTLSPAGTVQAEGVAFTERYRSEDLVVWQSTAPDRKCEIPLRAESGSLASQIEIRVVDPVAGGEPARARLDCDAALLANDFEGALRLADEMLRAARDDLAALESRGDALMGLGRKAEAAASYRKAVILSGKDRMPLLHRKLKAAQGEP